MADICFTPDQQRVIDLRDCNILVSAAAGSGKTAVLVEHIIQRISSGETPLDIDKMLVLTYTDAAAAQMREKICNAVAKKLESDPENGHLQRQAALVHHAHISTIHSFCLFVIRNYFELIDLDPAFRVADEGELKLLREDVLEELLVQCYEERRPEFLSLVETLCPGRKEDNLTEAILSLYDFSLGDPCPEEWLERHKRDFAMDKAFSSDSPVMRYFGEYVCRLLEDIRRELTHCLEVCEEPDGPYMYGDIIEEMLEDAEKLCACVNEGVDYETLGSALKQVDWGKKRLPSKKDDAVDGEKREYVKTCKSEINDTLKSLRQDFFAFSPAVYREQCRLLQPVAEELLELTRRFGLLFEARKREKNLIDFSDMEHLTLEILRRKEGDTYVPSDAAAELRRSFREVMVDEYQDANGVQEAILQLLSGEEDGVYDRFMVGDVKQSIYRFRGARPDLFAEKMETYDPAGGSFCRVDLSANFRSRREVLDLCNYLFERLMLPDLGRILYDDKAALHFGSKAYEAEVPENMFRPELLLAETDTEAEESARAQEAMVVATRILSLMKTMTVAGEQGNLRPLKYGDIVILTRSGTDDETFRRVLEGYGIPCYINSKTGYYQTSEVQTLLHLLRVLDNPLQDIPLYGALHSDFGGFSDEELARLSLLGYRKEKLYRKLRKLGNEAACSEETAELRDKAKAFLAWYDELRFKSRYLSVSEILEEIMTKSLYSRRMLARPGGLQRRANAEMLLQKAADYERTSYKGIHHFLRYIDYLEKFRMDSGEVSTLDEKADVVRIMSIHKSKGLEFPVCFVSFTDRGLNYKDTSRDILTDTDLGLAMKFVDSTVRIKQKTLQHSILAKKLRLETQAEEMRILYVAMTRAKEKLILTAGTKDVEKLLSGYAMPCNGPVSYRKRCSAGSYLQMILAALAGAPEELCTVMTGTLEDTKEAALEEVTEEILTGEEVLLSFSREGKKENPETSRFDYAYPHASLRDLPVKVSVSQLKQAAIKSTAEHEPMGGIVPPEDRTAPVKEADGLTGAELGTAVHRVMELLEFGEKGGLIWSSEENPDVYKEALRGKIEGWEREGRILPEQAESVPLDKVLCFLKTDLALRMHKAAEKGLLRKEQPFMMGVSARRFGEQYPEEETVLVQGIADAFFEEDGEIVLLDYKTDRVKDGETLAERYKTQLDLYREALQMCTGKRVKECILYSFTLGQCISM